MDALSAGDRLKLEAARSIREDYLHQDAFHDIDTYSSSEKMLLLMRLILAFYDRSLEALNEGVSIEKIVALPIREEIGRFKYIHEDQIDAEYKRIDEQLTSELSKLIEEKEEF